MRGLIVRSSRGLRRISRHCEAAPAGREGPPIRDCGNVRAFARAVNPLLVTDEVSKAIPRFGGECPYRSGGIEGIGLA